MVLAKELDHLYQMIIKMVDIVRDNLLVSLKGYELHNEKIEINDDIVDKYERLIEEICINIMVKERPYAKDLRIVSGVLKVVSDLERLGDHAEDIANYSNKLLTLNQYEITHLNTLVDKVVKMVDDSTKCFVSQDVETAKLIIKEDDEVDNMFNDLIEKIIEESESGKISSKFAIYTTLVVKYLERIADHAVNVAEWVIYIVSGYYKDQQLF